MLYRKLKNRQVKNDAKFALIFFIDQSSNHVKELLNHLMGCRVLKHDIETIIRQKNKILHEDDLVENVIDVEIEVEVAQENKRGRSKKLKTVLEKEKPRKRGRPPKSKK
ncbi:hypothetical protein BpHYR1_007694 [Brachionus plicatilis]|uniref:Uncharacterized protein n=1 Tax=Brachionus plicatilis TaxID=10195 RepID=A0A3M7S900_BRAPC|nr:hypothetical protein BpHYR1_007694 [Brachionus plicatilis]